jgi:hypothetical protein
VAYRIALGDMAAARGAASDVLRLARGVESLPVTFPVQHLATVAALGAGLRQGARLRGYVDARMHSEGFDRAPTKQSRAGANSVQHTYDILLAVLRETLSDAEMESLAAEGAQLSKDQAVAEAMSV